MSSKKKRTAARQQPKAECGTAEEPEGLLDESQPVDGFSLKADKEGYAIYLNAEQVGKAIRMGDRLRLKLRTANGEYAGICGKPFFSDEDEILEYLSEHKDHFSSLFQEARQC